MGHWRLISLIQCESEDGQLFENICSTLRNSKTWITPNHLSVRFSIHTTKLKLFLQFQTIEKNIVQLFLYNMYSAFDELMS
jgi:hypothetical protein